MDFSAIAAAQDAHTAVILAGSGWRHSVTAGGSAGEDSSAGASLVPTNFNCDLGVARGETRGTGTRSSRRSNRLREGFYAPSPGMVYPALTYLEEVGYATVEADGSKKLYRITDTGLAMLNENRAFVESVLAQLARIGGKMDRVRQAFAGDEQGDVGHRKVDEARQALRCGAYRQAQCLPVGR